VTVVDDTSFTVEAGEVLGIAGESGSGKTVSMMACLGLLPPSAKVEGRAMFGGVDLVRISPKARRRIVGREIAMVFQDPMSSLHPMLSIGTQLTDHLRHHLKVSRNDARDRAVELLEQVRIPGPTAVLQAFPHQFSGGMRQRIAIAIALACGPRLLIADEPTTALDVTVQAGIVRLLRRLGEERGLSIIMISHDLGLLATMARRIAVFYAGRIVESGNAGDVLHRSRHPYTKGLLDALPHGEAGDERRPLIPIRGSAPAAGARPTGCAFHPRCDYAVATCGTDEPALAGVGAGHRSACPVDPLESR
jgi:peptide/nickel transport system ATP-binding protein/oligopeptide transport system ATP-binding protein